MTSSLLIGRGKQDAVLLPAMANRHGLIAGATGTGKTVTLQALAESFSRIGVPVVLADVKGDLSGAAAAGGENPKVIQRVKDMQLQNFSYGANPVEFWDIYGEQGHPLRTTVSEMGPLLLARLLDLNESQSGLLSLVFKIADDQGLLLLDVKDLRAMLQHVGDNASQFTTAYGQVSKASVGAIQRGLLVLEEQGGDKFFGEPALAIDDLLRTDAQGHGVINILAGDKLIHAPKLYSTFLLWLLAELFEQLPEVGDVEKPKLVFFFDEAHLLFNDTPKALQEKIEQVVRLIRSKGVGVYFVTQSPLDVPEEVLGQLGNRVQHALRAFTPKDQKAVKSAAETFRASPEVDVVNAITEVGVGEALVSMLDAHGRPQPVQRVFICPPRSKIGPLTQDARQKLIRSSLVYGRYEKAVDRESAYELLKARAGAGQTQTQAAPQSGPLGDLLGANRPGRGRGRQKDSLLESLAKSTLRAAGSQVGRQLVRGLLGALMGGRR